MYLALSIDSCIHLTLSSYKDNRLFFGGEVGGDEGLELGRKCHKGLKGESWNNLHLFVCQH